MSWLFSLVLSLVLVAGPAALFVACGGVKIDPDVLCVSTGGTWTEDGCEYPEPTPTPIEEPTPEPELPACEVAERVPTFCRESAGVPPASWVRLDGSWILPGEARVCEPNDLGGCWHHPESGWEFLATPEPTPEPTPDQCRPKKRYIADNDNPGVPYRDCREWRASKIAPGATEVTGWPAKHGWRLLPNGDLRQDNAEPFVLTVVAKDSCDIRAGYKGRPQNDPTPARSRVLLGIRGYWVEDLCVDPDPDPTGACYAGTWSLECKWDSCEIFNGDISDTVNGKDYGAAARDAIAGVIAGGFPVHDSRIDAALEEDFAAAVVERLRDFGWCAASHADDPRVSPDEIALWPRGAKPAWKEHLDVCVATGQPDGECFVSPETRGLTARGWRDE